MSFLKSAFFALITMGFALLAKAGPIPLPEKGAFVGAYTNSGPNADEVSADSIFEFESQIGKKLKWAYFSNNWFGGEILFPFANALACRAAGTTPYIRLLPWTEPRSSGPDPYFKMHDFVDGKFDAPLRQWAIQAKEFADPLIIEFGPEVNGNWFAWNGTWNGGSTPHKYGDPKHPDGPERYRDAYRRIIDIFRSEGATNVTWVFHIDTNGSPESRWNHPIFYYPGDEYIDWIGLSVFGRQLPENDWITFKGTLAYFWSRVLETSKTKPVIISEFAVIEDRRSPTRKAKWLTEALQTVRSEKYNKRIKGISYWNSPGWKADGSADFRLTSSPAALEAFREELKNPHWKNP